MFQKIDSVKGILKVMDTPLGFTFFCTKFFDLAFGIITTHLNTGFLTRTENTFIRGFNHHIVKIKYICT